MPYRPLTVLGLALVLSPLAGGCQTAQQVPTARLIQHQALIDFSGLRPPEVVEPVRVRASVPQTWVVHGVERKALYTHQQWKSPSAKTAVGVVYARLPLPVGSGTMLWLARQQYAKQSADGKDLGTWEDALGRKWFEAETNQYHARGYVIVNGLDAWVVYSGFKLDTSPEPADIALAARCMEAFVPIYAKDGKMPPAPATKPAAGPAAPATQPMARN